ncbi:STY4851/ECs_5259 family protein [Devosia albogilva]|uniref:STY4851/ECs_5259 family protein n=1 Tax=Devosia albogilva TaxID=429726 RepID=A0ABW5QNC6_9HYPH
MDVVRRLGQLRKLNGLGAFPGTEGVSPEVRLSTNRARRPDLPPEVRTGSKPTPVRDFFASLFQRHSIPGPDERPLCLYRLTDAEFDRVTMLLRELCRGGRLHDPDLRSSALFVLYGAEWFRRRSIGGMLRWVDLAPDVVGQLNQTQRAELTERGLSFWKRPLRRTDSGRELLLSIALEGGIPLHAVLQGGHGWLREFLSNLMRRALLEQAYEEPEIVALAEDEQHRLVDSYRDEDFLVLCSRLVCSVLHWKRIAEERTKMLTGIAVDPVTLLDHAEPNWRNDIPIHVPADGAEIVTNLINGLVRDTGAGQFKGEIGTRRLLLETAAGDWKPALQLRSDGTIPLSRLKEVSADLGRGRVVPVGELARQISGAFALLEPPSEEDRTWRVRPLVRLGRPIENFPFTSPVAAEVVQDGTRTGIIWPGGGAVRSELLVFAEEEAGADGRRQLRLAGTGSVQSHQKQLIAAMPRGWLATDLEGRSLDLAGSVPELGLDLVHIDRAVRIRDATTGDVYLVEPGASPDERALEPSGKFISTFRPQDLKTLLFCGAPAFNIAESRRLRQPKAGEVFWRRQPGSSLHDVTKVRIPEGFVDVLWRDPDSGIQRDRFQVGVLPAETRITGRLEGSRATVLLEGLDAWRAKPVEVPGNSWRSIENTFEIEYPGAPPYFQKVQLTPPKGSSFIVEVPLATRNALLVLADGSLAEQGTRLALHDLRGAYFVAPHRVRLDAQLRGHKTPPNTALDLAFEGELALTQLGPLFQQLLSLVPDQDAVIELTIRGQSGRPWIVNHTRLERLTFGEDGVFAAVGDDTQVLAQSIIKPGEEFQLHPGSDSICRIPADLQLPALVYLREGGQVISRPALLPNKSGSLVDDGTLVSALSETSYSLRQQKVFAALKAFGDGGAGADTPWLRAAVTGLNGLTPSAFDALAALPFIPRALTRLLVESRDERELEAVWNLERELPFSWACLPIADWQHAIEGYFRRLESELSSVFPANEAMQVALETVQTKGEKLCGLDMTLQCILKQCGMPLPGYNAEGQLPLGELMQAHMRRMAGIDGEGRFDFAQSGVERAFRLCSQAGVVPPVEFASSRVHDFFRSTLIAPFLMAVAARKTLTLEPEDLWLIRRATHLDPDYVTAGYAHFLPLIA